MAFNGERKETRVVQNVRGSAPYLKGLPSKIIRRNIRTSHVWRMKQEVIHIFSPDNVFLPDDLFFIVLEFANLAQIGNRMLSFTFFFPHLVKRKHVEMDDRSNERVPPQ